MAFYEDEHPDEDIDKLPARVLDLERQVTDLQERNTRLVEWNRSLIARSTVVDQAVRAVRHHAEMVAFLLKEENMK